MSELTVKQVIDTSNRIYDSKALIKSFNTEKIHKERMKESYRCAICLESVSLISSSSFQDHFKHPTNGKNLDCPYRSGNSSLTPQQIDAIKYANTKESPEHKAMKQFLMEYCDKDISFFNPKEETVVLNSSMLEKSKWRKPDISVEYQKKEQTIKIAFEVQLQTILRHHIKGRQEFYKNNNFFMMWIFKDNDIQKYNYSEGDIFYNNNLNGFFINEEVKKVSKKNNKLMIGCKYKKYQLEDLNIKESYITEIIDFSNISFEEKSRKVFFYDVEGERNKVLNQQKEKRFIYGNYFKIAKNGSSYIYIKNLKITFFIAKAKSGSYYITKKQNESSKIIKGKWFKTIDDAKKYIYNEFYLNYEKVV